MGSNLIDILEREELIRKLQDAGYGQLVEILLTGENKVFTRRGRLNKSGACRQLGWKSKQLEDALEQCRDILKSEFED